MSRSCLICRRSAGSAERWSEGSLAVLYAKSATAAPTHSRCGNKNRFNPHLGCSQSGEDGILYSNAYALVQEGWSGVGIECDPEKFRDLRRNIEHVPGYFPISLGQRSGLGEIGSIDKGTRWSRVLDL